MSITIEHNAKRGLSLIYAFTNKTLKGGKGEPENAPAGCR